jgi:hypothetical protein
MKSILITALVLFCIHCSAQVWRVLNLNGKMFRVINNSSLAPASYDSVRYNKTGDTAYLYKHQEEKPTILPDPVLYEPNDQFLIIKFYLKGKFVFTCQSSHFEINSDIVERLRYIKKGKYIKTFKYDRAEFTVNENNLFKLK